MTLAPGTLLGPYKTTGSIGAGGMGEVYRARDERLGRDVAVKVLPAAFASDADRLRRFENEARAAAKLNHPNILQIYDVGSHEGHPYLVTELLEGETLRERLAAGPLGTRRAIEFAIGVAQGLAAAHDEGIVHRDLKPENLYLTQDGRVKILDFGLAKLTRPDDAGDRTAATAPTIGADTDPGMVMGTVGYMSPEQVRGQEADARSDIFSFGAILFEMVSGQRAFRGDTPADTMSAILKEDPPELTLVAKDIPPAFDRIVRRCLEKSPVRRFRSAQDLAFSLEAISTASSGTGSGGISAIAGEAERGEVVFEQVTHRPTYIYSARFAPDGQTVVYATKVAGGPLGLFMKRPETPEPIPIPIAEADVLAISSTGEMAVQLNPTIAHSGVGIGTLALAPMFGGAPRPLADDICDADFDPKSGQLAVIHESDGRSAIEYPIGTVLYETSGHVSYLCFSPGGDRIAFLDHPMKHDDRSTLAVIDLKGTKQTLTPEWASAQGLAWSADGEEVWFAATKSGSDRSSIYGVSLSGAVRQIYAFMGSIRLADVARNGAALILHEKYSAGILGAGEGETAERELGWLGYSLVAGISRDGKKVLFTEQRESVGRDYAVCIRGLDGSPVVRLGDGTAIALTPDGRWALSQLPYQHADLDLWPIGPGRKRSFPTKGYTVAGHRARFTPDATRAVMLAQDEDRSPGLLILEVKSGSLTFHPLPEEFGDLRAVVAVSPDGTDAFVASATRECSQFVPLDGSPGRPGPALEPGDRLVDYTSNGASVITMSAPGRIPLETFKIHLEGGAREPWRTFMPANPGGLIAISRLEVALDGAAYVYAHARHLGDIYVGRGLR